MVVKQGDRVVDSKGNKGLVTLAYNGECCIKWENGMTGSFKMVYLESNYIKKVDA